MDLLLLGVEVGVHDGLVVVALVVSAAGAGADFFVMLEASGIEDPEMDVTGFFAPDFDFDNEATVVDTFGFVGGNTAALLLLDVVSDPAAAEDVLLLPIFLIPAPAPAPAPARPLALPLPSRYGVDFLGVVIKDAAAKRLGIDAAPPSSESFFCGSFQTFLALLPAVFLSELIVSF